MFRSVRLPPDVPGALFLHSMPGFNEPYIDARNAMSDHGLQRVVCLTGTSEIARYSAEYLRAVRRRALPCDWVSFPIADMQAATNRAAYLELVRDVVRRLRAGDKVLVHCAYGIGRTGTFAASVLVALGHTVAEAVALVRLAGSNPETATQQGLIDWVAESVRVV